MGAEVAPAAAAVNSSTPPTEWRRVAAPDSLDVADGGRLHIQVDVRRWWCNAAGLALPAAAEAPARDLGIRPYATVRLPRPC